MAVYVGGEEVGTVIIEKNNNLQKIIDKSIEHITYDDLSGLTKIGNSAFSYCFSLTSITIPASVTSIDNYAFRGSSKLVTMRIESATPPTLANINAISSATTQIQVPMESVEAYKTATNWANFADIIVGYTE